MVADEKFKPTTSISGRALNAENNVIVLPEPGGPHKTVYILNISFSSTVFLYFKYLFKLSIINLPKGLCSASHVYSNVSCLTVSNVGTTTSGDATL